MNQSTIQRAKLVSELSSKLLMEDEGDDIQGEAYRFAYLILRGPKSFRQAFQDGKLYLDKEKVYDGYWGWRFDIPGVRGLAADEVIIIDYHNEMVSALVDQA
jgi:hypothetical protein